MINYQDQENLFRLISKEIRKNMECFAFGGNAMMFYGYKDETKDVDLLFEEEEDREEFIRVIKEFGFEETGLTNIYIPEKMRDKHAPRMFKKEDSRFDLFVKKVFNTQISPKMKEDLYAVHEFRDKHILKVKVLRKEHIVFLKAITERDKDFEDIITILKKEKDFDWDYFTDEVIWQYEHGDGWALLDAEKTMKELKEYFFIEEKYFKKLYKAADKK